MRRLSRYLVYLSSIGMLWLSHTSLWAVPYGPAGCGLGSLAIGPQPGFSQVFASTTNGFSGSQTFGISSGTSNCVPSNREEAAIYQKQFMSFNLYSLTKEIAQGDGEFLRAFVGLLGCEHSRFNTVSHHLQKNHSMYFKAAGAENILQNIKLDLSRDPEIYSKCAWLT